MARDGTHQSFDSPSCNDRYYPDFAERRAEQLRIEALGNQITELFGHINAANFRLLKMLAEFDREGGWSGFSSCADWLMWTCGVGIVAAREKVRVANALEGLPRISASFEKGELSYSKVRAMTRVATTENQDYLLMIAHYCSTSMLENVVRRYRQVLAVEAEDYAEQQHQARNVSWHYDDDGSVLITARLPAEQGELVIQAIRATVDPHGV